MSVYFVLRTAYATPLGKRVVKFDDENLLAWFQRIWPQADDDASMFGQHQPEALGIDDAYGIWWLFEQMVEQPSKPDSMEELTEWLDGQQYPEGEIEAIDHAWQVCTDDDELDIVVMMFDDEFATANPDRVAFLLHPDLLLPTEVKVADSFEWTHQVNDLSPIGPEDEAEVFIILLAIDDSAWLRDLLKPFRFKGVSLPDFVDFLKEVPQSVIDESNAIEGWHAPNKWRKELLRLREIAIEKQCDSLESLLTAYEAEQAAKAAATQERNRSSWIHIRQPSTIQTDDHFAQVAFLTTSKMRSRPETTNDHNSQWFLFDKVWAASHPDLAKSLLWFGTLATPLFTKS